MYGAFGEIVNKLIAQRPAVIAACEQILTDLMETSSLDTKKAKLEAEQTRITERVEQLMTRASREVVDDFTEQYAALEAQMNRVSEKLDAVEREKAERGYQERQCRLFMRTISRFSPADAEGAEMMDASRDVVMITAQDCVEPKDVQRQSDFFLAMVDKVIVGEGMRFILRDGSEWGPA